MRMNLRRRALIAAQQKKLPSGYQAVEWIGANRAPYINTNYSSTGIGISFETAVTINTSNTDYSTILGRAAGDVFQAYSYRGKFYLWNNVRTINTDTQILSGVKYNVSGKLTSSLIELRTNGVYYNFPITPISKPASTITIFAYKNTYKFSGTMDFINIYDNDVLVREYIPCYRISDNVIGMYDLCESICPLTGTPFYINAGTGSFTKGDDV